MQNILIYLFAFSLVFENWNFMSIAGNSVPKIVGYLLIFVSLFDYKRTFNLVNFKSYLLPLFGFLCMVLFSVLLNYTGNTGWSHILMQIVNNIFFFWILINILNGRKQTINNMILALNAGVLVMVLLFVLGLGTTFDSEGRLSLFGENPNKIGLLSVICILYIITYIFEFLNKKSWYHYLPLLFLIPLFGVVASVGSRVTFIGLVFTLSLFFLFKKNLNFSKRIGIIIFGGIFIVFVYNYFMSFDILQSRMLRFYEEQDISGRDRIWDMIVPELLSNPFFGIGINGYTELMSKQFSGFFSPHNVFIEVMVYSGLTGLVFFLIFLFRIFITSYQIFKYNSYSYPILVFMFFLFVYLSGQGLAVKFVWIFYAYILVYWHTFRVEKLKSVLISHFRIKNIKRKLLKRA